MMNVLERIVEHKRKELASKRNLVSVEALQQQPLYRRKTLSLRSSLLDENKTGIIAEFKRKSPSKGIINGTVDVIRVSNAYAAYGASGISVLTDKDFFGGLAEDIITARMNEIPILRKDFIVDEYQVYETKALGADVILFIAACLTADAVKQLAKLAKHLQLEVLLEIHDETELGHICEEIDLVGVNNRDLKTFQVDINRSIELSKMIPADKIKVAESGIDSTDTIKTFRDAGFKGFLIGERFMKDSDPGAAFKNFVQQLKQQ
ncbi:MAG TPA: indole-3-glycerol phosphate synthase TrpC [Ferruginibacter sp.]|nr:indole-3-glycerol phosphate synthase TrpC [Ferruginibacter sp.]